GRGERPDRLALSGRGPSAKVTPHVHPPGRVSPHGRRTAPRNRPPVMDPPCDKRERARLRPPTRGAMVLLALGRAGLFGVARRLEPSPTGYGTHTQLGLPPCHFAWVTGQRCPTCGMTTSFAWFVRGRLDRSWQANPAGSLLAPACLALIPWLLAGA